MMRLIGHVRPLWVSMIAAAVFLLVGESSQAGLTFQASGTNSANDNQPFAAQAVFTVTGNTLSIALSNENTGSISKYVQKDLLLAVFFDVDGSPSLTYSSATASTVRTGTSVSSVDNITNEWGYAMTSSGGLGGSGSPQITQQYGLGSAGFGISPGFGLGGGQQFHYGIVDNGFDGTNGNNPVNGNPLVQNEITFELTFTGSLSESAIKNVRFQYGTSLDEGNLTGTPTDPVLAPEPSTVVMAVCGIVPLAVIGYRRRRRDAA